MAEWHPDAKRVVFEDAGPYVVKLDKPTLCWHTTETKGLPSYAGTQPHFTLNPRTGELWQHQSIAKAAKALEHPSGTPDTNRANCIQVELICYSDEKVADNVGGLAVPDLTDADYQRIAKLARWIEKNGKVPRKESVTFKHYPESAGLDNGVRLSNSAWLSYAGHLGHQHIPNQTHGHGDPSNLKIGKILVAPPPWKLVKDGKVFARGNLHEMVHWLKSHKDKVRKLHGLNLRRNK